MDDGHLHVVVTVLRTPTPRGGELDVARTEWTRSVRTYAAVEPAVDDLHRVVGELVLADDGHRHRLVQAKAFRDRSVGQWSDHHGGYVIAWADLVSHGPVTEADDVPPVAGMELEGYRTWRVGYVVNRVRLVECARPACRRPDGVERGTGAPPGVTPSPAGGRGAPVDAP